MKMILNRPMSLAVVVALFLSSTVPAAAQATRDRLGQLFQVIDPEVDALIATPSLKRLSDEFTLALEGMDRAALLVGSRPIDHAKSMIQVHSAIDDLGGAAILFFFEDGSIEPDIVILVPVTDHDLFLESNFERGDDDAWIHADGTALHARPIGSWMAMSTSRTRLEQYAPAPSASRLRSWLGDEGMRRLRDGDVFMASGTPALSTWFLAQAQRAGGSLAMIPDLLNPLAAELWENIDGAALIIDLDPLATVLREVYRLKESSPLHERTNEAVRSRSFTDLPGVEHVVAMRANLGSTVARHILIAIGDLLGVPLVEDAAAMTTGVQGMLLGGGDPDPRRTIRHWALVYETANPDAWLTAVQQQHAGDQGVGATWTVEPGGAVEFDAPIAPDNTMSLQMSALRGLLLGTNWQGTFAPAENRVMLGYTHDRYPIRTLMRRADGALPSLDDDGVIQAMRGWLMADPDLELYVQPRQLSLMIRVMIAQMGGMLPELKALELPQFDEGTPAIGFGLRQFDDRVESMVIVPSQVLAPIADRTISKVLAQPGHRP